VEGGSGHVLARVDLGAADGLLSGMELVGRGELGFGIGAAEEVGEEDALVRFPVTDPPTPDRHPPLVGARVGTYDPLHPSAQGR
ncbi:MAG TPA: hypothetical protein VJP77_08150, partial [Planctomycetota bacterium]|nr:hypothetical protein [Planctomycetota bacterium]